VELKFELIRWMRKNGICRYREAIGFQITPISEDQETRNFCKALFEKCLNGYFPLKVEETQIVFHLPELGEIRVPCIPPDTEEMIYNIKNWKSWLGYMDHPLNNPENGFKYEVMTCF